MVDLDTKLEHSFPASDATASWTWDPPVRQGEPLTRISDIYDRVTPLLDHVDRGDNDLAIALLSRHLATFEHVWYPVAERRLSGAGATTWRHRRQATRLWRRMRLLQRCLTGDAQLAALDCASMARQVQATVRVLSTIERLLLTKLDAVLDAQERDALLHRWWRKLAVAPTRPHPHLPHHGRAEPAAFALARRCDRLLDTLDARPVPRPRQPRQRRSDRWTTYLTGQVPAQRGHADATRVA
jgi:hypothetical protein